MFVLNVLSPTFMLHSIFGTHLFSCYTDEASEYSLICNKRHYILQQLLKTRLELKVPKSTFLFRYLKILTISIREYENCL